MIPVSRAQWWYLFHMPSDDTCFTCPVMIPVSHTQWWYLFHMLSDDTCFTCPVMISVSHTQWWYLFHMFSDDTSLFHTMFRCCRKHLKHSLLKWAHLFQWSNAFSSFCYSLLACAVCGGWVNQAYSRLSTTHGHITDCKLDSVVYAGVARCVTVYYCLCQWCSLLSSASFTSNDNMYAAWTDSSSVIFLRICFKKRWSTCM